MKLGWTEAALIAGARDVGLSPSIVGSLPRKEAALVEVHFLSSSILFLSHLDHFWCLFPPIALLLVSVLNSFDFILI